MLATGGHGEACVVGQWEAWAVVRSEGLLMAQVRPASGGERTPVTLWGIVALALAPFPGSALMYCYGPLAHRAGSLTLLMSWSAIVLSFIAGVHWGLETREPRPRRHRLAFYALSAAAALIVLVGRGRAPDSWLLGLFIVGFMIQWVFDHQAPDHPSRYPSLSTAITGAACVSLALALERLIHR